MGGGAEKKKTNQMLQQQYDDSRQDSQRFNSVAYPQQQGAVNAANNIQQSAFGTLAGVAESGGMDPAMRERYLNSLGGGGGVDMSGYNQTGKLYNEFAGKSGGVDAGAIRAAMGASRDIAGNGGWDPRRMASMDENIGSLKEFGRTGGLDADAMNRMRGGGVFEEFQETGGYTPEQIADLRTRSNSTLPAFYDTVRQGQNRMNSIQGGNPAASGAMSARLARDQAKGMREQTLDTELGLGDRVREGRQWGAEGGAQAEGALQGLRTNNQLAGLRGASDVESNMVNSIAGNRLRGSENWTQGELGLGNMIQQGRMFGTSGLERNAGARASASQAGRGNETRGLQWLAEYEAGNRMNSAGGMTDLYRSAPGETSMWNNALLANRGMRMNEVGGVVDQRMANNPQRDWASTIGSIAGSVAGGMTGLGALGVGAKAAKGLAK